MPDLPPDYPHAVLTDLLAAQDNAAHFGCGLGLRLLELLLDRHAAQDGAHRPALPIRSDSPPQRVPEDWPHRIPPCATPKGVAHARR